MQGGFSGEAVFYSQRCRMAEPHDNPTPKPGLRRIVKEERKRAGLRLRDLARDAWNGMRGFG